ncbi:MAG TPA: hypothetical protein VM581_03515 [Magnetospirillaceae bacterium]|nr:hypothetical protein [Magnetospirillaceae bacterium]
MSGIRDLGRTSGTVPASTDLPTITGSIAFTNGPIARALNEYALVTGLSGLEALQLVGTNPGQAELIDWIVTHYAQIAHLRDLTSLASRDYAVLNSFLEAHGFSPLFTPFPQSDVGITAILDAPMKWVEAGERTTITRMAGSQQATYPAFKLKSTGAKRQHLFDAGPFTDRVVIKTQNGHFVYLGMLPEDMEGPRDGAAVLKLARQMLGARTQDTHDPAGVILPMISFDNVSELPWLNGLAVGKSDTLNQCRQHVKFYMNEIGARISAAFAGVMFRSAPPAPYVINQHFVLAIADDTTPTTVLYLHPDDSWAEPPAGVIQ